MTTDAPHAPRLTRADILDSAAGLAAEDDDNPEYDRALAELSCELLGLPMDRTADVLTTIRLIRDART